MKTKFLVILAGLVLGGTSACLAADRMSQDDAAAEMHRAVNFFRERCSASGSYVFRVSAKLQKREGEGKVGATTGWLEPPSTPTVGSAYTEAYLLTGDELLKRAAIETAQALVRTQLKSGGWYHRIEFDEADRKKYEYRVDRQEKTKRKRVNQTTFDDDKSQSAARFLMELDRALEFRHEAIHEAALFAVDSFVKAQYANGAWPQRYSEFPDANEHQPLRASYPKKWSRVYHKRNYSSDYTLNDNTISDTIETMLLAWATYADERYLASAKKGGDFLLAAQLPEPQPGWAQQYDVKMQPVWARKFEPPAITGGESQGVIRTLMVLFRRTGDRKYLQPIPRAVEYYREVLLASGELARFYEIGTNKPLYFTKDYQLTYSDADMPTHYGFKVSSKLDRLERDYKTLLKTPVDKLYLPKEVRPLKLSPKLAETATKVLQQLDERGAWVEQGRLKYHGDGDPTTHVIESRTFCKNLIDVARYVGAKKNF